MKHVHKTTGKEYVVGKLVDFDGSDFDIKVITEWPNVDEADEPVNPIIVGYYFGDYDAGITDYYIDQYLETGNPNV